MTLDAKIGIFTDVMRTEFNVAYQATAEPAAWEKFTQRIPSTARIEHYTWMSPSPGLARYAGHRRFGMIDTIRYSVNNLEFDAAFEVLMRDIKDDQTAGYTQKPKELAERAKKFPGRWVLKTLALGTSATLGTCFDGTAFFADSHTIGTGDNKLAATGSANSDGLTYNLAALYHGGALKPLLWQDRMGPDFETDGGTPQAKMQKTIKYWIDMEGNAAYGYWWDAVLLQWTNLPTVTEFQTGLGSISAAFRGFTLPKSLASEDGEYIHEQTDFNQSNLTLVGSAALERIAAQALNQEWIPQTIGSNTVATTNLYKGWSSFVPTNFF